MPDFKYASAANLARITPGELSPDQAIPSFFYMDPNSDFKLTQSYVINLPNGESFWDSVASSLRVGSYITCVGKSASATELVNNVATVRVASIEPVTGRKYPHRVKVYIGPNTLFNNIYGSNTEIDKRSISGMELQYRGIVQIEGAMGASSTVLLGFEGVDANCWCWGRVLGVPGGPPYADRIVISEIYAGSNQIEVHYATNNQPTVPTLLYIYLEAFNPITQFN